MVFRERHPLSPEREGLLSSGDDNFAATRNFLRTANWKSVSLGIAAGLIPFFLWVAIFQNYEDPTLPGPSTNLLQQPVPFVPLKSSPVQITRATNNGSESQQPLLASISKSPNWKKVSTKTYRKNKNSSVTVDVHDPTEFGTYPEPTFRQTGNRSIACYKLVITKGVIKPDGFPQPAILVNGQSPGPEIRVKQHSILLVTVENKLDTPVTIHFHGIHQRKSFLSDGVPHVTQDPIPPGGSYTYKMNLWPQTGTYFYHAHTHMDIVWLFGPFIVEDDPSIYGNYPAEYQYDEDRVFILNGVYHEELASMVEKIVGPVHDYPRFLSSITINGRAFTEWTNNITGEELSTPTATSYDITTVKQGMRYRFRFINAASDSILACTVADHMLTVIEADGIYVEPTETDRVLISPGQRYSVILAMDKNDDNYFIKCRYLEIAGPLNGVAILKYFNATKPSPEMLKFYNGGPAFYAEDRWVTDSLTPNRKLGQVDVYDVPKTVDKEHIIEVYEAVWGQRHVYLVNGHYYQDPTVPYFRQLQQGINITDPPQVFELIEGETVQFVFQNTRLNEVCFSHPWHIHGHDFYVVGDGANKYDPEVDGAKIQQDMESGKKFQLRDAVTVWANQTVGEHVDGAYCGWVAVRFPAHNNGLWLAHCHVTPHLIMGKRFVIWEHGADDPMLTKLMSEKFDIDTPGDYGGW